MNTYPFFSPPEHLAGKDSSQWSLQEAREYKDWVLRVLNERVDFLLRYIQAPRTIDKVLYLQHVGLKVEKLLLTDDFSERSEEGRELSNRGYALAADMGLLVAQYLFEEHPNALKWKVVRGAKRDISYNSPGIYSFATPMKYLDPIFVSINIAHAIVGGFGDANDWAKLFEEASSQVISN